MDFLGVGDTWTPPRMGLYFCYHKKRITKMKTLLVLLLCISVLLSAGCGTTKDLRPPEKEAAEKTVGIIFLVGLGLVGLVTVSWGGFGK